jgi:hypothetical protein
MTTRDADNQRSRRRQIPDLFLRVVDAGARRYFGDVVDVTESGLRLTLPAALTVGSRHSLIVEDSGDAEGLELSPFEAEVRWCHYDDVSQCHQAGLLFTLIESRDARELAQLANRFPLDSGSVSFDD